jgi:hypothetical protein
MNARGGSPPGGEEIAHLRAINADLLAACDQLLGEVGRLLYLWSEGDPLAVDPGHRALVDRAHAAIARARGEQP